MELKTEEKSPRRSPGSGDYGAGILLPILQSNLRVPSRFINRTFTMKVIYNGIVLAESDKTEVVEGNHYFPPDSVKSEFFSKSSTRYAL